MVITVKNYGEIRKRYLRGESQRQIAKELHISRNTVSKYCAGGESTVRAKVRELRQKTSPAFVPLVFAPGEAIQVDWGEAMAYIASEKQTINLFCALLLRRAAGERESLSGIR